MRALALVLILCLLTPPLPGAITLGGATSDRVVVGSTAASMNDLAAYTIIIWIYPTTITNGRLLFRKDNSPATANRKTIRMTTTASFDAFVTRATTSSTRQAANSTLTLNAWNCIAVTYDESDDLRLWAGTLSTPLAEVSYASSTAGAGATGTDGTTLWIGNQQHASPSLAFQGRIATVQYLSARLTAGRLQDLQYRPHVTADTVYFAQLGFNELNTQPDLSGNGNSATVTGSAVSDHVPLPAPFAQLRDWLFARAYAHLGGYAWL
jgi:hypothetical protein